MSESGATGAPESPRQQWQPPAEPVGHHSTPPPAGSGPNERYLPLSGPAWITIGMLVLVILVDAAAVASDLATGSLLQRNPAAISRPELRANLDRQGAIGLLQTAAILVTAAPFIVWFHRAYKNLRALGSGPLRYGTGWAIGGWFVPIMNFFRPKQIVNDIWRASDPDLPADHTRRWVGAPIPALYAFWWGGWLVGGGLSQVAGRFAFAARDIDDLRTSTLLFLISDSFDILVAVLAILVVRRTTRRQEERARRVGPGTSAVHPPAETSPGSAAEAPAT